MVAFFHFCQSEAAAYFEPMFGTPLPIVIERIARLYDAEYKLVDDLQPYPDLIQTSYRLRIIEIQSTVNRMLPLIVIDYFD